MGFPFGAAIGAGASIIGGLLGSSSASDQTSALVANNAQNIALQKQFAKKGIRWRVEDAKKAGIHPLYAMGASLPTYSPQGLNIGADNSMGQALAQAGQDVGRAVSATMTQPERDLSLKRSQLQNQLLQAQILKLTRESQTGPPLPSASNPGMMPGQGNFPSTVDAFPRQITATSPDNTGISAGAAADISYVMGADGKLRILPSPDAKELMEDQLIPEIQWAYRNLAKPLWNADAMRKRAPSTAEYPLPPGYHWQWVPWDQAYVKTRDKHKHKRTYGGSQARHLYSAPAPTGGGGW